MSIVRLSPEERAILKEKLNQECDYIMPDKVMDRFLGLGHVQKIDKWRTVIACGDMNPDVYILMEGIMRCWYTDDNHEKTAHFATPATQFINYHTYYAGQPSFYNFQACTPVKLLRIRRHKFNELLEKSPEFALWNLHMLQAQSYYFELKHKLNTGLAMDKYLSLIKELPNIMQVVPLQVVASYLGITPLHLSRLRRQLLG